MYKVTINRSAQRSVVAIGEKLQLEISEPESHSISGLVTILCVLSKKIRLCIKNLKMVGDRNSGSRVIIEEADELLLVVVGLCSPLA